jgi:drug/metabolite transporter (DMT)-like permease
VFGTVCPNPGDLHLGLANVHSSAGAGHGIALLVVAAFAGGTAVVIQKAVPSRASRLQVTWLGCAAGALVCLPFAPVLSSHVRDHGDATYGRQTSSVFRTRTKPAAPSASASSSRHIEP